VSSNPGNTYSDRLQPLVANWLPHQRWYGGKGREVTFGLRELAELPDTSPVVTIWIVDVEYPDGAREAYQLPLVLHEERVGVLEHMLIGTLEIDGRTSWVYDALHDKSVTGGWLRALHDDVNAGPLRFTRLVPAEQIPVDAQSLALSAEQSNTSLIYGADVLLKVFRRLQPGVNPDIEVQAALSTAGGRHIAQLFGFVEAEIDGESYALAMAQQFLSSATDGWALATASVRDLLAEADLHAEEAGGDFAGEAQRLGAAVAAVHADLVDAFGTASLEAADVEARVAAMHARLQIAVETVPEVAGMADSIGAIFDELTAERQPIELQRIHGDLHLAQALRTAYGWVVIDFEGEPAATLSDRRLMDSALRDVAGMLRSFEYAGHYRLVETGADSQLAYRAAEWSARNRDAFCTGYAAESGTDPRERDVLLRAYEADKAVYEAVYEARNRPAWLTIPLATLNRLTDPGAAA
jgi:maltokinase